MGNYPEGSACGAIGAMELARKLPRGTTDDSCRVVTGSDEDSVDEHDAFVNWLHDNFEDVEWEGDADGLYFYKEGSAMHDGPFMHAAIGDMIGRIGKTVVVIHAE